MRLKNMRRVGVVAWPVAAGALILASCGSDATGAATASTINLDTEATNYIVKDPVTTTIAPLIEEDATATGSQVYIVQAGDYAIKVANLFEVPLEDLLTFNGWASGSEFPFPGEEVLIPPGGIASPSETPPADAGAGDDGTEVAPVGDTIPLAGDNCAQGKHTVVTGDYPLALSKQYDVTLASLDAANSGNAAYSQFVPGQEIIIPAKSDC